jgi:hypothetical protein
MDARPVHERHVQSPGYFSSRCVAADVAMPPDNALEQASGQQLRREQTDVTKLDKAASLHGRDAAHRSAEALGATP